MKIVKENDGIMVLKESMILPRVVGIVFVMVGIYVTLNPGVSTDQPSILWSSVFIVLGFMAIFLSKSTTIILDKSINQFTESVHSLVGRAKIDQYSLSSIKKLETRPFSEGSNSSDSSFSMVFILDTGEEITFNVNKARIRVMGRAIKFKDSMPTRVATFLNVPFEEMGPPSTKEVLSTIYSAVRDAAEQNNRIDL